MKESIKKDENVLSLDEKISLKNVLKRLEDYYPEHKIYSFKNLCDSAKDKCAIFSKLLNYESVEEFLRAYGYEKVSHETAYQFRKNCGFNTPGKEPLLVKERVERAVAKLNELFPDKIIEGALENHKHCGSLSKLVAGRFGGRGTRRCNCVYSFAGGHR